MKIEIEIAKTGRKGFKRLEGKTDAIAEQVSELRGLLVHNHAVQHSVDHLTATLKRSNDSLESAIKKTKGT